MNDCPGTFRRTAEPAVRRDLFAWSLLTGLLLLMGLAGPFFAGRVYTYDDLGAFHLPARAFYARQLQRGEPFDWMPHLYSGLYLTGEGQAGTYHPLHLLLYRLLPLRAATAWECLAGYPVMMAGAFLLLRRKLRRRDAAMFGAVVFAFSSFNLLHFVHPNAVAVVAHIPWMLWTLDVMLLDSPRRRVTLAQTGYAALTGSQLLVGYPQYVWFSLLTEAAYVAFVVLRRLETRDGCSAAPACPAGVGRVRLPWTRLVMAKTCGVMIGWVQVLPTIDALAHSTRHGAGVSFAETGSLHPLNLLQLVAPYLLTDRVTGSNTHELGLYAGAVPLLLAVWAITRRRRLGRQGPLAMAAGAFALAALLMALGRYAGFYRWQTCLPLVGSFRFPCRYLVLFQSGLAVLAALGFALLVREHLEARGRRGEASDRPTGLPLRRRRGPSKAVWLIIAGSSAAVAAIALPWAGGSDVATWPLVIVGPLLLGGGAALMALAAGGQRWALIALVLYTGVDLGIYGMTYGVYPGSQRPERYLLGVTRPPRPHAKVATAPRQPNQAGPRTGNQVTLTGGRRADGYAGLEPASHAPLDSLAALRVAGVEWVRNRPATRRIDGLQPYDEHWLRVPDPLPRARLVTEARVSCQPERAIGQIDMARGAVVACPIGLPGGEPGSAALTADRPGRLTIEVQSPTRQLLVVSERFDPGWQAWIGGQPRPVLRVNGDYLGCLVGPGRQRVVLAFRPPSLRWGRMVSLLGVAATVLCYFAYGRPRKGYA
ncbi:MAG: hypothetical protein ACOC46_00785 [Pirellulales bacterium]